MPIKNFDTCVSFHIDNGAFRGRFVRMNEVLDVILGKHCYPKPVSAVIAESTVLAALLASSLKYKGLFTLQTQSSGPITTLVVDVNSEGVVRACARFDEEKLKKSQELRKTTGEIEAAPHLMGGGLLAFTVDQGKETELYQGVVELQGKTLTECALRYFKQSEQIDTYLQLYLRAPANDKEGWKAAGVMIQKMPEEGGKMTSNEEELAEAWNEAKIFMESLKEEEIFDENLSPADVLHRLYHANNLVISATKAYQFGCRCTREKLLSTLSSFAPEEIEAISENNQISASCNFCSEKYLFDKGELIKH